MKKTDRYCFPAVFSYEEGQEISVFFPDQDVATSGVNEEEAGVGSTCRPVWMWFLSR